MSWRPLRFNRNVEDTPWVSIGVSKRPADGYGQIKLTLSATVALFLDVAVGDKVHLERGWGNHQGWVRIAKRLTGEDAGHSVTASSRNCRNGNVAVRVSSRFLDLDGPIGTERMQDVVPSEDGTLCVYTSEDGKKVRMSTRRTVGCQLPDAMNKQELDPLWVKPPKK